MGTKTYDELDFTDDFLFCRILEEKEDLCIDLAELITGRKIKSIVRPESQKSIRLTRDGKGVRFDVYFADDEETVYDIEMQTVKRKGLPKRSRYYQGMIDLNVTSRKMKYHELPESYIIFICTFDEFNRGRHVYTFENRCIEDPTLGLDDGSHKIFLCAKGTEDDCSEKMKEFLDYVAGKGVCGELSRKLEEEVQHSKSQEKWRLDYMTLEEKYEEKYEEGMEKGKAEEKADIAKNLIRLGKLSFKEIAGCSGMTVSEIEALAEKIRIR